MTDNEILKALECHSETSYNQNACERCPILNHCDCGGKMAQNALDLINRQKEIIEAAISAQETLQRYIAEKDADIERLRGEIKEKTETIVFLKDQAVAWSTGYCNIKKKLETDRAEAIKEFATALKTYRCIPMASRGCSYVNCEVIDELVQEMVGD